MSQDEHTANTHNDNEEQINTDKNNIQFMITMTCLRVHPSVVLPTHNIYKKIICASIERELLYFHLYIYIYNLFCALHRSTHVDEEHLVKGMYYRELVCRIEGVTSAYKACCVWSP